MEHERDDLRAARGLVHWGLAGLAFWAIVLAAVFG